MKVSKVGSFLLFPKHFVRVRRGEEKYSRKGAWELMFDTPRRNFAEPIFPSDPVYRLSCPGLHRQISEFRAQLRVSIEARQSDSCEHPGAQDLDRLNGRDFMSSKLLGRGNRHD